MPALGELFPDVVIELKIVLARPVGGNRYFMVSASELLLQLRLELSRTTAADRLAKPFLPFELADNLFSAVLLLNDGLLVLPFRFLL